MNKSRIERVIANMNACGLDQILVTATPSVYYLTGKWVSPGERMLALYLNSNGDTALYANRLFALNGSEGRCCACAGFRTRGRRPHVQGCGGNCADAPVLPYE